MSRWPDLELRAAALAPLLDGAAHVEASGGTLDPTAVPEGAVVTCFDGDVLPHVETLVRLSADRAATVVVGVPNDAFEGRPGWGEGAFAELLPLLPADAVTARLVPLAGAALVVGDAGPERLELDGALDAPAVELVVAFGPRAALLAPVASGGAADRTGERRAALEQEAQIAVLRARVAELEAR